MGAFDNLRGDQIDHGYWGHHTGTIDWCETNYSHSRYIAEFVNSLTNFPSIFLGLYGLYHTQNNGIPLRYGLCFLGLSLIGIGSFGFHASLRWEWQLMDELPMIYLVTYAGYLCIDTLPSFKPRFGIWGPLAVLAFNIFVTISYAYLPNPIYHQIAFAAILISSVGRLLYLTHCLPASSSKHKLINTFLKGIAIFAGGFGIWNIDNIFCDQLRTIRDFLGPVLGMVVQGHGFWHLMTGYGSFLIFTAAIYLQLSNKVSPKAYIFDTSGWIPTVKPSNILMSNGHIANGK